MAQQLLRKSHLRPLGRQEPRSPSYAPLNLGQKTSFEPTRSYCGRHESLAYKPMFVDWYDTMPPSTRGSCRHDPPNGTVGSTAAGSVVGGFVLTGGRVDGSFLTGGGGVAA